MPKRMVKASIFLGLLLSAIACGPGTVYVGVSPGPWMGYPPGYPGRYPGAYGRPWYSPEPESPVTVEEAPRRVQMEEGGEPANTSGKGAKSG